MQICEAQEALILSGVVSEDYVQMHLEYLPSLSVSDLVRRLEGNRLHLLQQGR